MRRRCNDPQLKDYPRYGGRGIKVCEEWNNSFDAFKKFMGDKPEGMTLERFDVNGNYEPGNVGWASVKQQARNRSTNVWYEIEGVTKTLAEWAEFYNLGASGYKRAHERIKRGWSPQEALEVPPRVGNWARQ